MSATMKMFCMFITLVSYFISVRQIYDTFIVHTLTEDVKVKRSSQVDIRIGNFFWPLTAKFQSVLKQVPLLFPSAPQTDMLPLFASEIYLS